MKFLTLNVHGWLEEDAEQKMQALAKRIHEYQYDVIALQEVNQLMHQPPIVYPQQIPLTVDQQGVSLRKGNYAVELAKCLSALGSRYYLAWGAAHIGYDRYDEGLAILAKTPFKASSYIVSDEHRYDSIGTRTIMTGHITDGSREWRVVTGHFSWWKDTEGNQCFQHEWQNTIKYLDEYDPQSIIVMGDFNNEASKLGEGYQYIYKTAPFLVDTYAVAKQRYGSATVTGEIDGWKGKAQDKRIDYIFASKHLEILQSNVVFDGQNGPVVSDHFGIEVVVGVE